ncbi:unnamed protein product [Urochloa humidicola]
MSSPRLLVLFLLAAAEVTTRGAPRVRRLCGREVHRQPRLRGVRRPASPGRVHTLDLRLRLLLWQVGPVSSGAISIHAMSNDNMNSMGKLNLVTGAGRRRRRAGSGAGASWCCWLVASRGGGGADRLPAGKKKGRGKRGEGRGKEREEEEGLMAFSSTWSF